MVLYVNDIRYSLYRTTLQWNGEKDILQKGGDTFVLHDGKGVVLGKALRSCDSAKNPIYVSIGHKISLDSAVWLVYECCKYRIPELTRQADINSREYLRKNGYVEKF